MTTPPPPARPHSPTLADALVRFFHARFYMAVGALVALGLALLTLAILHPHYRIVMVIAPPMDIVNYSENGSEASAISESPSQRAFDHYRSVITGVEVADVIWRDPAARSVLTGWRNLAHQSVLDDHSRPQDVARFLKDHITLDPPGLTRAVRVVILAPDPVAGQKLLRAVHRAANQQTARLDHQELERAIARNRAAFDQMDDTGLRKTMAQSIRLMERARVNTTLDPDHEYAARMITAPMATPYPVAPPRVLTILTFLMVGVLVGYLVFALRHPYSPR